MLRSVLKNLQRRWLQTRFNWNFAGRAEAHREAYRLRMKYEDMRRREAQALASNRWEERPSQRYLNFDLPDALQAVREKIEKFDAVIFRIQQQLQACT